MNRKERTEQKMQELFHSHAAGDEGSDGEFMQILQGYIFGDVCYTGSLDNRMRELVTVTVLTALSALPQLKAHVGASLNAGCTPVEIREAVYQRKGAMETSKTWRKPRFNKLRHGAAAFIVFPSHGFPPSPLGRWNITAG